MGLWIRGKFCWSLTRATKRPPQAVIQGGIGLEAELRARLRWIEAVASNLALPRRGEAGLEARAAEHAKLAAKPPQPLGELQHGGLLAAADVVGAVGFALGSHQRRLDDVADVDVIAGLTAVAVHYRPLAAEQLSAEDRDDAAFAERILPRPVDVRESQIDRGDAMQAPIQSQ